MAKGGSQVKNGKAFEYALATQYADFLNARGIRTEIAMDSAYTTARSYFCEQSEHEQKRFNIAAFKTISTIARLEPGLSAAKNDRDVLRVALAADSDGQEGDVRDVIFTREASSWEIGFSAKNNHEAVKHSRLSRTVDFGEKWLGIPCSLTYWDEVTPVFMYLQKLKKDGAMWHDVQDKASLIYMPILAAFRKELLRIDAENEDIPKVLIKYLIGKYPFYKIIKDDSHNLVVVKAFNLEGQLNKPVNGEKAKYKTPSLRFPTRIVEFEKKVA